MENFKEFLKLHNSSAEIWDDKIILNKFSIESHDFQIIIGNLSENTLRLTLVDIKNNLHHLLKYQKVKNDQNLYVIKDFNLGKYEHHINQKILNTSVKAYETLENVIKESVRSNKLFADDNRVLLIDSFQTFKLYFDCESFQLYHNPFYIFSKWREGFVQVEISPKPNDLIPNSSNLLPVKGSFVPESTIYKEIQSVYHEWLLKNLQFT